MNKDLDHDYTMSLPLQILPLLEADFDGDVLNLLYIINKEFFQKANEVFNPRNNMHVSKNDGRFDQNTSHQRDTIVNLCTFNRLGKKYETSKEKARKIELLKKKQYMIMNNIV